MQHSKHHLKKIKNNWRGMNGGGSKTDLNSIDKDFDKELTIREYREASLPRITEQRLSDLNKEARESYENIPIALIEKRK